MLQNINSQAAICQQASQQQANPLVSQFELINRIYQSKLFQKVDLTPTTKLVLYALVHHYNPANEDMFPSQKFIAQSLDISEKSVERAVKELANKRLIMYVTKTVNRYKFTQHFFELVKLSDDVRQNVGCKVRQNVGQTYKHEQKNNNKVSYISPVGAQMQTGRANATVQETKVLLQQIEEKKNDNFLPKDFEREDARKWLDSLPAELHGGVLAQDVYKTHGFTMSENVREVLIQRGKLPKEM